VEKNLGLGPWAEARENLVTFIKCNFFHDIGSGSILHNSNTNKKAEPTKNKSAKRANVVFIRLVKEY
jgi:hypothetical protein